MRTIRTKIYKLSELSKETQEKAIQKLQDINIDHDWYESVYEDAKNVGIKITGFDLDRNEITGKFIETAAYTANRIIAEHGDTCETHSRAKVFINDLDKLVEKYSDGKIKCSVLEENVYQFDGEANELEEEFLNSLLEDYRIMLRNELEYQTSEEAIKETIEANEYEFYSNGTIFQL